MAPNPYIDSPKNKGLKGLWNKTLGREDMHGMSYAKIFMKETMLTALGVTHKLKKDLKNTDTPEVEKKYSDTLENKEWTPFGMAVACGILTLPVAGVIGGVAHVVTPDVEYDYTLSVPQSDLETASAAYSLSSEGINYVLVQDEGRFELYKNDIEEDNTLVFMPQNEAAHFMSNVTAFFAEDRMGTTELNYSYQDISEVMLNEEGRVIRNYEEASPNYQSLDLTEGTQSLEALWTSAAEATLTSEYGPTPQEFRSLHEEYTFSDGFSDGYNYGILGVYAYLVLSMAAGTAAARVNANPANGNRRRKKYTPE